MWLFTTVGFFSVTQVQKRLNSDLPEGTLQVRARVYEDVEVLRERYLPEMTETIHLPGRDYPYRGYVDKQSFSAAMVQIVHDLTYSNFKDEVKHEQGKERADLYMGVWSVMYQAEQKIEEKRQKSLKAKSVPQLPFERTAYREMEEDNFQRELEAELMAQERDREDRINRMKWANTWDRYDENENGEFVTSHELLEMEGMNVVEAADLFAYGGDDFEDDILTGLTGTIEEEVPTPKKKKRKRGKRKRRRGN